MKYLKLILTFGIPQLIDAVSRARDRRKKTREAELEARVENLEKQIEYRRFVEQERERRRMASADRGFRR